MFKKLAFTLALAAFVATLVLTFSPGTTQAATVKGGRVQGTLTAVSLDGKTASITRLNGTTVTISVNAATKIERNGRRVPLSALKVGDRAQARFNPTTMIATKLESVGP